jgi:hypothetical protein
MQVLAAPGAYAANGLQGVNFVEDGKALYGSMVAAQSFSRVRELGADTVLTTLATLANEEKVEMLAIGTELEGTSARPEWQAVITDIRARYHGPLTYIAHGREEMAKVPFWSRLDYAGVSLYPSLGTSADTGDMAKAIEAETKAVAAAFAATGKPGLIGELGLRSAVGAQAKPWESAEERQAAPDPRLQARVLALWAGALDRAGLGNVLLWRWISDSQAGGPSDTDFTIQNKMAEGVAYAWFLHGGRSGQTRP